MTDKVRVTSKVQAELEKVPTEDFQAQSDLYVERYLIPSSGSILWVRHRAILDMIKETRLPRSSRILDLGCGPGFLSFDLAKEGYCGIGLDAAPAMIQRCNLRATAKGISDAWHYQLGNVEALPFRNESFDAAICAGVIEYLTTSERMLQEVARVLRPEGLFILCVTNKYGYTVSLSSVSYWFKKIPGIPKVASVLRRILVGGKHGVMQFTVPPRKHRPSAVRKLMAQYRFRVEKDRYLQFTFLPEPFCALTSRLKLGFSDGLDFLDRTPLRVLGSCYMVCTRKSR